MRLHKPRTYLRMVKSGLFGKEVVWEPRVWKTLKRVQGDLFVDIGANQGIYTLSLRKHFKHIMAVEPHPQTAQLLREKVAKYPEITVVESALCEMDGEKTFYLQGPPFNEHPIYKTIGSLMTAPPPPPRCTGSADTILPVFHYRPASMPEVDLTSVESTGIKVKAQRLDSLIHGPISLVKIDVEGAEFLVLEGAGKLFKQHMIKAVMVELHDREQSWQLEDLLTDRGLRGSWIDPDHYYATLERK